jgi:hypothetical protein
MASANQQTVIAAALSPLADHLHYRQLIWPLVATFSSFTSVHRLASAVEQEVSANVTSKRRANGPTWRKELRLESGHHFNIFHRIASDRIAYTATDLLIGDTPQCHSLEIFLLSTRNNMAIGQISFDSRGKVTVLETDPESCTDNTPFSHLRHIDQDKLDGYLIRRLQEIVVNKWRYFREAREFLHLMGFSEIAAPSRQASA